jgi:hypothetical protein
MKKLILALLAIAALVTASAASASAYHQHHGGHNGAPHFKTVAYAGHAHSRHGVFERLRGTGTDFSADSATASGTIAGRLLDGGSFAATISTDWSNATANKHGGSCAPATSTLSLTGSSSSDTLDTSGTGVTCTVGSNPWNVAAVYFGKASVTAATGALANVSGKGRLLLVEKTDGTVRGFTFAGFKGSTAQQFGSFARSDAQHCGGR